MAKKHIRRIVVVDDGLGMDTNILPYYLPSGFSTKYRTPPWKVWCGI